MKTFFVRFKYLFENLFRKIALLENIKIDRNFNQMSFRTRIFTN